MSVHIDLARPEWVVRQANACVFVQAPSPEAGRRDRRAPNRADGRMEGRTERHARGLRAFGVP